MDRLPPEWVACKSKSSPNKVYYFNKVTRKSQWQFPVSCLLGNPKHRTDRASNNAYYLKNFRVKNSFVPSENNGNLSPKRCQSGQCSSKNNNRHHIKRIKNGSNETSTDTAPLEFKLASFLKSVSSSTNAKVTKSKEKSSESHNSYRKREDKQNYFVSDVKHIDTLPIHLESQITLNKEKTNKPHFASDIKFSERLPKHFESEKYSMEKELQKHSASGGKFTQAKPVQFVLIPTRNINKNLNSNQSAVESKCKLMDIKGTLPPKQYSKNLPLEFTLSYRGKSHKLKKVRKQLEQFKKNNMKDLYFNATSTKPLNHEIKLTEKQKHFTSDIKFSDILPKNFESKKYSMKKIKLEKHSASGGKFTLAKSAELSRDGIFPVKTLSNSVPVKYEQSFTTKKVKQFFEDGESSVCSIVPLEKTSEIFNNLRGNDSSFFPEAAKKTVEESCSADVEMEDISNDHKVPCLEDFFEPMQLDENNSSLNTKYYYIVVDTNVLISNLKFVNMLKDASFTEIGPAMIYIPWVVLQELDGLKQKSNYNEKENSNLSSKASQAIRFLYSLLKAKHPQICGQTAKMAAECSESSVCNDDQILMCCLKLVEKVSKEQVMLLTNDKNLSNKALINDITVNTEQSLKEMLASEVLQSSLTESNNIVNSTKEINDIIEGTKSVLKFVLENLLVLRMNETFGSKWQNFVAIQPPWSLMDVILCIKQHWVTSFNGILAQDLLNHIEIICCEFKEIKDLLRLQSIIAVIAALEAVCQEFQNRCTEFSYGLKEAVILKYRCECWCKNISSHSQRQCVDTPKIYFESTNHHESIISVFQYLWNAINSLCGLILDYHGFQHNFVYTKPVQLPKMSDINILIPELYSNLYELWKRMRSALDDRLLANEKNITNLYNCLIKFVPSLRIEHSPPPLENFSECSLKAFFLDEKNRMLLENGYVQLRNFHTALCDCVKKVVPQSLKC